MTRKDLKGKTFFLIAKYWLDDLVGFVKIGDDREEIIKEFEKKYCWKAGDWGATEESYQLLECTAKELSDGFNIEEW